MTDASANAPSFGDAIGAALRDTWPALRGWLGWAIAIVVVVCGGLIVIALFNAPTDNTARSVAWEGEAAAALSAAFLAAAFFALASAVRTVRPEFRMSVGRFFGVVGYTLLVTLIVMVGLVCLVVPGLYLLVKLGLAPFTYLLQEPGGKPLAATWERTHDRFWLTAGLLFAVGIMSEIAAYATSVVIAVLALISPILALIGIPIAFAIFLAAMQFQYNAYVRWTSALLKVTQA